MKILLIVLLSWLIACSPRKSSQEGGADGGGGNGNASSKLRQTEIQFVLNNLNPLINYVLNFYESDFSEFAENPLHSTRSSHFNYEGIDLKLATSGMRKLIQMRPRISQLQLKIEPSKPCYDHFKMAKDAAARVNVVDTVCLSLYRLEKKMSSDNVMGVLLSLLAHEYSHVGGASEAEAKALQAVIQERMKLSSLRSYMNALDDNSIYDLLIYFETFSDMRKLIEDVNAGDLNSNVALCSALNRRENEMRELVNNSTFSNFGLSAFSHSELEKLEYARDRYLFFTGYCANGSADFAQKMGDNDKLDRLKTGDVIGLKRTFAQSLKDLESAETIIIEYNKRKNSLTDQWMSNLLFETNQESGN